MAYTEYNQRRALGTRYGIDPYYLLDKQRLEQEYSLVPTRERLAEEKRQFDENKQIQQKALDRQGMSSMIGTVGNLGATYLLTKGTSGIGAGMSGLFGGAAGAATPSYLGAAATGSGSVANSIGMGMGSTVMPSAPSVASAGGLSTTITPALTESGTIAGSATPVMGMATPALAGVGGGLAAGAISKTQIGKDIGKVLLFGQGGDKEQALMQGMTGGAGMGAIGGFIVGGPIGAAVGAVVGGLVGGASSLIDSWICTATNENAFMTKEEKEKMNLLKIHAIQNHFGWWNSYLKHGVELTRVISEKEKNLPEFYGSIRLILIEPVYKEENIEKCFQIYLAITKMLFKAYMPEYEFKEEG